MAFCCEQHFKSPLFQHRAFSWVVKITYSYLVSAISNLLTWLTLLHSKYLAQLLSSSIELDVVLGNLHRCSFKAETIKFCNCSCCIETPFPVFTTTPPFEWVFILKTARPEASTTIDASGRAAMLCC